MKLAALLLMLSLPAFAVDDLPQRDGREPLDFEPSLKLTDVKPEAGGKTVPWETPLPDLDQARTTAERAQRTAVRWTQLQKRGVVSKVEAERAGLLAVRATLRYQQVHVAALQKRVEELAARKDGSPDLLATAKADLARAQQMLADSEALAKRTDLEFAQNQLTRQQQLARFGLGSKSQLTKAKNELERAQTVAQPTEAR